MWQMSPLLPDKHHFFGRPAARLTVRVILL